MSCPPGGDRSSRGGAEGREDLFTVAGCWATGLTPTRAPNPTLTLTPTPTPTWAGRWPLPALHHSARPAPQGDPALLPAPCRGRASSGGREVPLGRAVGLAVGSGGVCQSAQRGRGEPWWPRDLGPVDKGNGLAPRATTRLGPGLPCGLETLTWTKKCHAQVPSFWVFFQMPT